MFNDLLDLMLLRHIKINQQDEYNFNTLFIALTMVAAVSFFLVMAFLLMQSIFIDCSVVNKGDILLHASCSAMQVSKMTWINILMYVLRTVICNLAIVTLLALVLYFMNASRGFWTMATLSTGIMAVSSIFMFFLLLIIPFTQFLQMSWSFVVMPVILVYVILVHQRLIYATFRLKGLMSYLCAAVYVAGAVLLHSYLTNLMALYQ